jgi:hypothetical protein
MEDKIEAEFLVISDKLDHAEVTDILGFEPSEIITKGHIKREAPSPNEAPVLYKESVWNFKFSLEPHSDVYECLDQVLEFLRPKSQKIAEVAEKYFCEVSIFGFSSDDTRLAFNFDSNLISELSKMKVSLDLDVYPVEKKALETEQQISGLVARLMQINTFADKEEEATRIAKALAYFESESANILENLPTLTWDQLDDQDVEMRLTKIKECFAKIEYAFHDSKLSPEPKHETSS